MAPAQCKTVMGTCRGGVGTGGRRRGKGRLGKRHRSPIR
ncbi:hypothetical protein AZ19_0394 [Bordetella bronchiseptica E012]|nr:hypothetical protein L493_0306 [Bordetella bronchiseptica 99-R-0433]KDC10013.1 hypothetical protein AZ19_0394 [Bordetella bronchiseptica E012]KDC11555.1 hypothetical protein AZ24_0339 [Bordetella bronchiseptica E013]